MNTNIETREWLFSLAASKLTVGDVIGERPTLVEIERWRNGALLEPRAAEVLSYIAYDEQSHEQWRDLCEEQRWLDNEKQADVTDQPAPGKAPELNHQSGWLGGVAARLGLNVRSPWAGAVAAGLFALLLIPAMFQPGSDPMLEIYQQQLGSAGSVLGSEFPPVLARVTKNIQSLDGSVVDQNKHQFQLGLAAAAQNVLIVEDQRWDAWRASLPQAIDCTDASSEHCSEQAVRNQALGSWSLVTALACSSSQGSSDFWQTQASALNKLASGAWAQEHFLAARLQQPLPQSWEKLCVMATGLLGQGG